MRFSLLDDAFRRRVGVTQTKNESKPLLTTSTREFAIFFLIIATVAIAGSVMTLTTYPAIHTDEPWYANLAYNWITTGNRWTTLDIGPLPDGRGQSTTALGAVPTRIGIQLWGLSLKSIRLPSLVAGLALLVVVAAIGYLLWPGRSGALAALVLALQPLFLLTSHLARPEVWLALVVLVALGCSLLGWKRNQPLWDAISALLAVLAVDIHQNGAVFAIGLAATYPARYGRDTWRKTGARAFFGVGIFGMLLYFYRSGGLLSITSGNGGGLLSGTSAHTLPLLSSSPIYWLFKEMIRYLVYFGHDPIGALLLILAIGSALRKLTPTDRMLLSWLLGSAVGFTLLVSRGVELYLLPMLGVGNLLVGRGLAELLRKPFPWSQPVVASAFGALMLPMLLVVGGSIPKDTQRLQRELQSAVPCQRILGPNLYWLAFAGCDYHSFDVISHYHQLQGFTVEESLAAIRPDYVIIDSSIEEKLQDDFGAGGNIVSYYTMPRADLQRFLDERARLERLLFTPDYGTIQVWYIDWEGST